MNKANKRGITLIELICVLAVVAILGPLIGGFITTAGAQYTNAALHTRAKSNVIMLQQVCESDLRLATAATITDVDSPPPPGTTSIHMISGNHYNGYFYAGLLGVTGAPYLGSDSEIYNGMGYVTKFQDEKNGSISITITAYQKEGNQFNTNKKIYSSTSTIKLLNVAAVTEADGTKNFDRLSYEVSS